MALYLFLRHLVEKWAFLTLISKTIFIKIYILTCQIKENSFPFKIMYNKPNIINLKKKEILLGILKAKILCNYFCLEDKIPKNFFLFF